MLRAIVALLLILGSLVLLEVSRAGVTIERADVGDTPVSLYARPGAEGPVAVIAHGFAGSRQMMQGYALPLARAGYRVHVFDFLGHGRHDRPMSGDVGSVDGTTRLLVDQTAEVVEAAGAGGEPIALLGHSMATDVLVRVAAERGDIGPVVLVSAFSEVIDASLPRDLLLVTGAWEPGLRGFALEAARMVDPGAEEGETVIAGDIRRRAEIAPFVEHVSVLYSRAGRRASLDWLDTAYGRSSNVAILPTGWAILGLLGGLVLIFAPLARRLPAHQVHANDPSAGQIALAALGPAILAPLVAVALNPGVLPVLVADYLALHLALFGAAQILLLWRWGVTTGPVDWRALGLLALWCALFGLALDRYAANFLPTPGRLWIIAALALGAVPFMLADALLTYRAGLGRRFALRGGFFLSLGIAVALDFEGLFFLMMIAPVILLFFAVFGTMGRAAGTRSGPLAPGLVLGLALAWALGVSFPLFQA
ncbi:alpha/beta hydrolase [Histidinibacterium lentulum]|uniref:Alpha/beta fold hydrolase n=1 Tax=Histidinibacterium lentulum TaxID=2480588 RepID=A0A3N2R8J3_9RHOB|nr:alpha/beta fold hydrolase [Histidinibacterium lentulum]ROU03733.1 alpha/beta fold hydrolase [Histidinibacterium lentulum]